MLCASQGRIKHERMPAPWTGPADPRPDFLAAAGVQPERAEPYLWMAWHHHRAMDACPGGPDQAVCWLRERAAAYHYAKRAAALDMPDVRFLLSHSKQVCTPLGLRATPNSYCHLPVVV